MFFFFKFNEQLRALQLASYKLTFASSVGGGDIAKLRQLPDLLFSLGVPILRVDLLLIFLKYKKSKLWQIQYLLFSLEGSYTQSWSVTYFPKI